MADDRLLCFRLELIVVTRSDSVMLRSAAISLRPIPEGILKADARPAGSASRHS